MNETEAESDSNRQKYNFDLKKKIIIQYTTKLANYLSIKQLKERQHKKI